MLKLREDLNATEITCDEDKCGTQSGKETLSIE